MFNRQEGRKILRRIKPSLLLLTLCGLGVGLLGGAAGASASVTYTQIANLTGPGIPEPPFGVVSDIVFADPASHRVLLSDDSNTFGGITGQVDAWDTFTNAFVGNSSYPGCLSPPAPCGMFGGFTGTTGFPGSFDQLGPDGLLVDGNGRIWAGNGDGTVKVGNLSTMTEVASVATGSSHRADELAYDSADQRILVTNPSDSPPFVTVINALPPFNVIANISLGTGIPNDSIEQPKYDALTGNFLISVRQVTATDTNGEVARINGHTLKVLKPFPLTVNCNPAGMALGPGPDMLLGCDSFPPVIMNRQTGAVDVQLPQACCADEVWFNPGDNRYYAAEFGNPGGAAFGTNPVVMVIDARKQTFLTNIPILNSSGQPDPSFHAVAADSNTNHVYVPTSEGVKVFAASGG
jgi:DNA-binding beta-propeller fold protein YncE